MSYSRIRYIYKILFLTGFIIYPLFAFSNNSEVKGPEMNTFRIQQIDNNIEHIRENISDTSDQILKLAQKTLSLSKEQNYVKARNLCCFYLGLIYKSRNKIDSAFYFFEEGLSLVKKTTNYTLLANFYWELSELNRLTGNYSAALENSLTLKDLIETQKIAAYSTKIYNLLGLCYQALLEYESAFHNFEKAVLLANEHKDFALAGIIYSNIGRLCYEQKDFSAALKYFEKGVKLEEKYNLFTNAAFSYDIIANIYLGLNKPDSAKHYLTKAYSYFTKYNSVDGQGIYYLTLAKYYLSFNNHKKAEESLEKAIEIGLMTERKITLIEAYKLLADIKFKLHQYKDAYLYFDKYFTTYNKMYDVAKINKAKALEQKLAHQKREAELVTLELGKQKTFNLLLVIIIVLAVLLSAIAFLYLMHLKRLNKELKESKLKAEESDKLKSQFLRTISHEIRTPLNGITGFSEMILNDRLDKEELAEIQKFITKNSEDLISTIENMVDMAHLTTKQYHVSKSNFEVSTLLTKVVKNIKETPLYINKSDKVKLKNSCKNSLQLYSDKSIIKKILRELIKNALQYTDEGSVTVGYDYNDTYIKYFIKDTGVGVSQEHMDKIFSPFMQTNEAIRKEGAGTGLGLSLVNEFLKLLNGKIWFGSEPNKGTSFFISLPIK